MNVLARVLLILPILPLMGCESLKARKWLDQGSVDTDTIYVSTPVDANLDFAESLYGSLEKIGLKTTREYSESNKIINISRYCYYDLIHYTCRSVDVILRDSNTGEVGCELSFAAVESPFSYESQSLDIAKGIKNECY
ncbi:hypothetical protein [Oceanobacter mangrovi]|uniref:hypothetical protein n=1 Tax=Oceanobacter mangrovi TaxID=2862510 RepID=UPI001C8DAA3B|nr:hypothetical protein [Oceanobacter mangrovi]